MKIKYIVVGFLIALGQVYCATNSNSNNLHSDIEMGNVTSSTTPLLNRNTTAQYGSLLSNDDKKKIISAASEDILKLYFDAVRTKDIFINRAYNAEIIGYTLFYIGTALTACGTAISNLIGCNDASKILAAGLICLVCHGCLLGFAKVFSRLVTEKQDKIDNILNGLGLASLPDMAPNVTDDADNGGKGKT